jgi:ABC-type phosphate/phosphonate transport system substrate-binding protein
LKSKNIYKYYIINKIVLYFFALYFVNNIIIYPQSQIENKFPEHNVIGIAYSDKLFFNTNLRDAQAATKVLTDAIIKKKGIEATNETIIFHDISAIESEIQKNKIDIVALPLIDFIKFKEKKIIEPFAVHVRDGNVFDRYILLIRKDSGIKSIRELKNKKLILLTSERENISYYWLESLLFKNNFSDASEFFSNIKEADKASQAVLSVFFKNSDVCIVLNKSYQTVTELNPQIEKELTVLEISPEFVFSIVCIRSNMTKSENRNLLEETLLNLHNEPQGKQILTLFKIDRLKPYKPEYIINGEFLLKEYDKSIKNPR